LDNAEKNIMELNQKVSQLKSDLNLTYEDYRNLLDKLVDHSHQIMKSLYAQNLIFLACGVYILKDQFFRSLLSPVSIVFLKVDLILFGTSFLSASIIQVYLLFQKIDVLIIDDGCSAEERKSIRTGVISGLYYTLIPAVSWAFGVFLGMIILGILLLKI